MKQHPELFTTDAIETVKNYHLLNGNLQDEIQYAIEEECKKQEIRDSQPKSDDINTFEECMKQFHITENDKGNPAENAEELNDRIKSSINPDDKCAYKIEMPKIDKFFPDYATDKKLTDDKCDDRFVTLDCGNSCNENPNKIVRFEN